jgi:hypothetical protein
LFLEKEMSTLVTHHDGLDRVFRGWETVSGKRHIRAGGRTTRPLSLFARVAAAWSRSREDARYAAMLLEDPRMMAEFQAAKARAEWQD